MTYIITHNEIEGFHRWPEAPNFCSYLRSRHRHVFVIECRFEEIYSRENELIKQQQDISDFIEAKYGVPAEFGHMSCEQIAEEIVVTFGCKSCEVREDGYGGAGVTK